MVNDLDLKSMIQLNDVIRADTNVPYVTIAGHALILNLFTAKKLLVATLKMVQLRTKIGNSLTMRVRVISWLMIETDQLSGIRLNAILLSVIN